MVPDVVDFGEIDFMHHPGDMPSGGYNQTEIVVTNKGDGDATVEVTELDWDHLCVEGFTDTPIVLPTLAKNESYILLVGVCDYDAAAGERDTLVSGSIPFAGDDVDNTATAEWSFTPTIVQD